MSVCMRVCMRVHVCVCVHQPVLYLFQFVHHMCVTASRVRGERKPVSVCVRATVCMCVCVYTCVCKYAVCVGVSLCLFVCVRVRQHVCV